MILKKKKPLLGKGFKSIAADWTGLEPATSAVTGRHSNQLNYQSFFRWGCKYSTYFLKSANVFPES